MIGRYLHIAFHFDGAPLTKELESIFSEMASDWIRYSANCWIVWTVHDPLQWDKALLPKLRSNDQMLILELKPGVQVGGRVQEWIWEWIRKSRPNL